MICVCRKICCGAWRAYPFAEGGIVCPCGAGGIALDEVNDRLYARRGDAGSTATRSVSHSYGM